MKNYISKNMFSITKRNTNQGHKIYSLIESWHMNNYIRKNILSITKRFHCTCIPPTLTFYVLFTTPTLTSSVLFTTPILPLPKHSALHRVATFPSIFLYLPSLSNPRVQKKSFKKKSTTLKKETENGMK